MKRIVFIGCAGGLNDPNIGELFRWVTSDVRNAAVTLVRNEGVRLRSNSIYSHMVLASGYDEHYSSCRLSLA